jgi:hypothetical protein
MGIVFCESSFTDIPKVLHEFHLRWHSESIEKDAPYKVGDEIRRMCYFYVGRYYTWRVVSVSEYFTELELINTIS